MPVTLRVLLLVVMVWSFSASTSAAQPIGTFRWQLAPYCNVVTVAVTQVGGLYRLEGTDDQCGAPTVATVTGLVVANPNGTLGFGLTIVNAPGAVTTTIDAEITLATLGGTWRDNTGHSGTFVFTPGAGTGGSRRPLVGLPIIPSGQTVTGYGLWDYSAIADNQTVIVHVELPGRMPVPITTGTLVNFAPDPATPTNVGDADATCTGTAQAPTAPPGKVCLYAHGILNVDALAGFSAELTNFYDRAFLVRGTINTATVGADARFRFTWAYTAP